MSMINFSQKIFCFSTAISKLSQENPRYGSFSHAKLRKARRRWWPTFHFQTLLQISLVRSCHRISVAAWCIILLYASVSETLRKMTTTGLYSFNDQTHLLLVCLLVSLLWNDFGQKVKGSTTYDAIPHRSKMELSALSTCLRHPAALNSQNLMQKTFLTFRATHIDQRCYKHRARVSLEVCGYYDFFGNMYLNIRP